VADIKQAAIWLREGKRVFRPSCIRVDTAQCILDPSPAKVDSDGFLVPVEDGDWDCPMLHISVDALLAEDWEIAA
jgi:hypothetical protein